MGCMTVIFLITGMSGPMLWLQNCLNRTAEDREEDGKSNSETKNILFLYSAASGCSSQRNFRMCEKTLLLVLFGLLMTWLWSILQVSPRRCHLFLWRRKMKKPWKTRAFGSCCANWECEHLQMSRCVFFVIFHYQIILPHSNFNYLICTLCLLEFLSITA